MAPTPRPTCILLAGPSSAGKTSLAKAFQRIAPEPWFFFEADRMSGGFPRGRVEFVTLEWDRRVREASARAARGVLEAGLHVIVELGLFEPWGRAKIAGVLSAFPTFVIRVSCDLAVLEEREKARSDRFAGTARRQWEQMMGVSHDYEVISADAPRRRWPSTLCAGWPRGPRPGPSTNCRVAPTRATGPRPRKATRRVAESRQDRVYGWLWAWRCS